MVNHITDIANLLKLPDLEETTKADINSYLREQIKALSDAPKKPPDMPPDLYQEWVHGKGGGT